MQMYLSVIFKINYSVIDFSNIIKNIMEINNIYTILTLTPASSVFCFCFIQFRKACRVSLALSLEDCFKRYICLVIVLFFEYYVSIESTFHTVMLIFPSLFHPASLNNYTFRLAYKREIEARKNTNHSLFYINNQTVYSY